MKPGRNEWWMLMMRPSNSKTELVSMGQDVESKTLTQAIRWFAEHRVLLDGDRTVIFE